MSKEEKKAPEVRFAGFHDDWKQRKVLNMAEETFGGGTPKTSIKKYWDGSFPWFQSSDLKLDELNNIKPTKYLTTEAIKNSSTKVIPKNSIAIVTRVGVGKLAFIPHPYATSQDFLSLASLKVDMQFGVYSLYKRLKKELNNIQGTSIKGITKKDLLEKDIMIPLNTNEQKQIGFFFKQLDHTIALHQRKLDKLKEIKKAALQSLFPKNGKLTPKVRFANFNGIWQQCKLSEISEKVTEKNKNREITETLTNSAEFGIISQNDFFEKVISNSKNIDNYYIVQKNDFVYNPRISYFAPVGPIKRNKLNRDGIMSPLYYVFRTKNINLNFLEKFFDTSYWHKFMKLNGDTGARADRFAIKDSVFKEMPIPYPNNDEQFKIGNLLKQLDSIITFHQTKLKKLQSFKKTFLQKMFV